jgi:hypothetical protein
MAIVTPRLLLGDKIQGTLDAILARVPQLNLKYTIVFFHLSLTIA